MMRLLKSAWIDTPLGPMLAISDEDALHLLEFTGRKGLKREIEKLKERTGAAICPGHAKPLSQIDKELQQYFAERLEIFETPIKMLGTPFQKQVWRQLQNIPYGKTCSYRELAHAIGRPNAYRAVAGANGANQLALIIPCHRVINADGGIGGYGGGIAKKQWLLRYEKGRF
ncbi:MAG: hypothetical protein Tsb0015_01000 [Simkaniaceae bacterium]